MADSPVVSLVLLDGESLAPAAALASGLAGCKVFLFDPTLLEKAQAAGLENAELLAWSAPTPYPDLVDWAHAEAYAIERSLDAGFGALFPGASFVGWQHLNLHYILLTLRWYAELAAAHSERFSDGTTHVLLNDNPAQYYWPSFLPGLLLLQRLIAAGGSVKAFTFGRRPEASRLVPDLRGAASAPVDLLVHLPTSFHDSAYFNAELAASGRRIVNLQARQWNIDTVGDVQVPLVDLAALEGGPDGAAAARIDTFLAQLQQRLEQALQSWIASPEYRQRQAAAIADLVRAQLFVHEALQRHFAEHTPGRLLLTEHDAGFHGPLLSFAAKRQIPVLLLPHSKTITDIEFSGRGVTTLTHPLQADGVADAAQQRVPHQRLAYPESFRASSAMPAPLRCVGLLLNGLTLGGVLNTPYDTYVDGIARIAQWCRQHQLQLKVRSRPGQVMTAMLVQATGLDPAQVAATAAGPLDAFVHEIDACLMYDAPTNAAVSLLGSGVPVLNPVPARLSRAEGLTCSPLLVPREDIETTLARLAGWVADPAGLFMFGKRQFAAYVGLFSEATALREWL